MHYSGSLDHLIRKLIRYLVYGVDYDFGISHGVYLYMAMFFVFFIFIGGLLKKIGVWYNYFYWLSVYFAVVLFVYFGGFHVGSRVLAVIQIVLMGMVFLSLRHKFGEKVLYALSPLSIVMSFYQINIMV
jgi:hypothetical protein